MPGISSPGIRVYPFTHAEVGYWLFAGAGRGRDALFPAPLPTTPQQTLICFIAAWRHQKPGAVRSPFVYLVHESDAATLRAMEDARAYWARNYPSDESAPFDSNPTEAEILEAVDDVIAEWGKEHPGALRARAGPAITCG
jgi:hypothetical protein